jgi:outer membrane protein W
MREFRKSLCVAKSLLQFSVIMVFWLLLFPANAEATVAKCAVSDRAICKEACNKVGGTLTTSGSGLSHTCTYNTIRPLLKADLYVSTFQLGDFEPFAAETFADVISRQDLFFDSARVDTDVQIGVGAVFNVTDWLAIDIGLATGTGGVSLSSVQVDELPVTGLSTDFRLFTGAVSTRFYPFQNERLRPWLGVGARGLALRPTAGVLTVEGRRFDVPAKHLKPVATTDLSVGLGLDLTLTRRFTLGVAGDHGFQSGWRIGAALAFSIPQRTFLLPDVLDETDN